MVDDLPFSYPDMTPANPAAPAPKKCRRHDWALHYPEGMDGESVITCLRCGRDRDEAKAKQGRRNRRLGGDQERRIERVYGPVKIGERGDPVDHLGRLGKWQSKATRGPVPQWLAGPMRKMAGLYGDRIPILILSFVRPGVSPEDYIVISGKDWLDHFGRDSDEDIQPVDPYTESLGR